MFSFLKNFTKTRPHQPRAQLTLLCRDRSITQDELFVYTNGHFLIDEQRQRDRRYVKFNVDALCSIAAAAGDKVSRIMTIEKMEGGFSKALLMTKENGSEVIAKIPCRIAGPSCLTTASEVGVLEYVRKNTSIPVPRVLAWSADSANPVGAEYIIMEKAPGVPLFQRWADMAEIEKLELIKSLTKLEAQLSAVRFPAYGGIYLRTDGGNPGFQRQLLEENVDPSGSFCIGPSCDRSFHPDPDAHDSPGSIDPGPWTNLSQFGIAIARRELMRSAKAPTDRPAPFYHGSIEEKACLLEATIELMHLLDSHSALIKSAQPTLWHTDLHMGNIYVASDDNSRIVSLIDFQSASVLPAFLQARWPVFLTPPRDYMKGLVQPKLPDGFEGLDKESQTIARQEWTQAKLAKAYEVSTYLEDRPAHDAMALPHVFRELFIRCGEVSEMGVIPLRACLIEVFENWSGLGFSGPCPFSFENEEISTHKEQFRDYQRWHEVQRLAWECLDTDAEGWVAPQLDITEKRKQNRELLAEFVDKMAEEMSSEEARRMWPFPN